MGFYDTDFVYNSNKKLWYTEMYVELIEKFAIMRTKY
jgi:hypothetical protein